MALDNDTRGWVMAIISGIACVMGSSLICLDLLVRRFPSMKNFRIQDSNGFLSGALSLSFGVMLFSSLYIMLPSSRAYLIRGGLSASEAGYILMSCFLGGVVGIQIVSRVLHRFIPSHVVDCDHSHQIDDEVEDGDAHEEGNAGEETPLLSRGNSDFVGRKQIPPPAIASDITLPSALAPLDSTNTRRPSMQARMTSRVATFISGSISGSKASCDETGSCYGFGDPCGQECFKALSRSPSKTARRSFCHSARSNHRRASLHPSIYASAKSVDEESRRSSSAASPRESPSALVKSNGYHRRQRSVSTSSEETMGHDRLRATPPVSVPHTDNTHAHHHHVPANAFLSIGLQTSIAIALHKLPEGFITYATNHANPKLGVTVFLALFIHNITEGFAMALPLYLALNSRVQAMVWSSILGGLSQPLGAGVAALWFGLVPHGEVMSAETAYGAMFAATAGIMSSVALQLFSESLDLTHNRNVCTTFAFVGMALLGFSSALTAN